MITRLDTRLLKLEANRPAHHGRYILVFVEAEEDTAAALDRHYVQRPEDRNGCEPIFIRWIGPCHSSGELQ